MVTKITLILCYFFWQVIFYTRYSEIKKILFSYPFRFHGYGYLRKDAVNFYSPGFNQEHQQGLHDTRYRNGRSLWVNPSRKHFSLAVYENSCGFVTLFSFLRINTCGYWIVECNIIHVMVHRDISSTPRLLRNSKILSI